MFQCVCAVLVCACMYASTRMCACILYVYLFYCLALKQMWEPKGHTHSPVFRPD